MGRLGQSSIVGSKCSTPDMGMSRKHANYSPQVVLCFGLKNFWPVPYSGSGCRYQNMRTQTWRHINTSAFYSGYTGTARIRKAKSGHRGGIFNRPCFIYYANHLISHSTTKLSGQKLRVGHPHGIDLLGVPIVAISMFQIHIIYLRTQ